MRKFWNWIRDDGGGRVLRLEGPIDEESIWSDGVTPKQFREELYAEDGDVTIWINSPGGNVFCAAEVYTMIRDYPGTVTVKIDAIAASAASVVAMAGDRVMMSPVAMIMVHDPMTIAMGNARAMEKAITTLNEVKESIINAYVAKTGLSRNKVAKLMSDETWLNAKKAVELGFADEILFADKKTETEPDPEEEEDGDSDGDDDTPEEEKKDGAVHLLAQTNIETLEGVLYSTRAMGQTILNSIGAFAEDEGATPLAEGEASSGEAHPAQGDVPPAEDELKGEATPVAEDSAAQEKPVSSTDGKADEKKPDKEKADVEKTDQDKADAEKPDPDAEQPDKDKPDEEKAEPDEGEKEEDPETDKDKPKGKLTPTSTLPEGFIAIDQNGRTQDGSMPYFILKNQLDRMR